MRPIGILLVDDNPEFLETAARFLMAETYFNVLGRARSGPDALEQSNQLKPDLVVMDLAMPGMSGLETTRHLKAIPDPPVVIILTLYDNAEYRAAAAAVGADGFVPKSEFGTDLQPLIHALFNGMGSNPSVSTTQR
jgi:DNA-binding NarL/FixJ family response regulator